MNKIKAQFLIIGIVLMATLPLTAQEKEGHIHGEGLFMFLKKGNQMAIQSFLPAEDIVGFERKPKNGEEEAQIIVNADRLGYKAYREGDSSFFDIDGENIYLAFKDVGHGIEGKHAQFMGRYLFSFDKLNSVDLAYFFDEYPTFKKLHWIITTEEGVQGTGELTPKNSVVKFE